uniref:Apple domain-containing protein n=1 Tax=Panagrolaimus sp. JU765 TaxID=591449 RepID=A0AC34QGS6_9BILA
MDEAITPNGQLQYTPHADSVYFEKICIPVNELPLNCDDVVHRIPQRVLDGQADATVDAPNQIDCIRRCITASRLLGFTCQSATYYFEFPVQNCILNRFTRTSRPNSFAAELRQKVDYMEMAPCMIIDWQQRDVAWSEWSECDQTSTKTRKRNCTNCDKKQETVACSHPKSSQSDFPIITKNIESDLIPVRKQIVTNFDSAKNLRKQEIKNLPDDEKSLFGENDYENQHEVSYFGPPRNEQKMDNVLDSKKIEDITVDAVKELEKAAMREARNHRVETTMDNEPTKTGNHLRSTKTEETYENELNLGEGIGIVEFPTDKQKQQNKNNNNFDGLRKLSDQVTTTTTTTEKSIVNLKPVQIGPIPIKDSMENCDPKKDCCPLIDIRGRKSRGCTLGYKINSKNQQEGCVPDECRHKNPGFTVYI